MGAPDAAERPVPEHRPARRPAQRKRDLRRGQRYEVSFEHPTYQVLVLAGTERSSGEDRRTPEPGLLHGTLAALGHEGLVSAYGGRLRGAAERGRNACRQPGRGPCPRAAGPGLPARPAHAGVGPCYDSMTDILTSYNCALLALRCEAPLGPPPGEPLYARLYPRGLRRPRRDAGIQPPHLRKQFAQAQQLMERLYTEYLYAGARRHRGHAAERRGQSAGGRCAPLCPEARAAQEVRADGRRPAPRPAPPGPARAGRSGTGRRAGRRGQGARGRARQAHHRRKFCRPDDGPLSVSEQLNVSNSYLSTTFKVTYGVSIIQYINRLRVDQAKSLILNTDMNIKDIAQTAGFSSDINFIRCKKAGEPHAHYARRESCL